MDVSLEYFLENIAGNPILLITVLLTLGVIFVNGWTDAPNAIATCVTTRCLSPRKAILMSAAFNFLGVFIMTQINSSVASTISNMVDFGDSTHDALIALCAALVSIVVYSVGASIFGIPTSESHSLIAGLSGAAIAIQQGIGGINGSEWVKVLYGLVLSLVLGFLTGWVVCRIITVICREMDCASLSLDLNVPERVRLCVICQPFATILTAYTADCPGSIRYFPGLSLSGNSSAFAERLTLPGRSATDAKESTTASAGISGRTYSTYSSSKQDALLSK